MKKERIEFGMRRITDEERLEKLKFIYARRNDAKAIEVPSIIIIVIIISISGRTMQAYRQRYFERRAAGLIVPVY